MKNKINAEEYLRNHPLFLRKTEDGEGYVSDADADLIKIFAPIFETYAQIYAESYASTYFAWIRDALEDFVKLHDYEKDHGYTSKPSDMEWFEAIDDGIKMLELSKFAVKIDHSESYKIWSGINLHKQ